MFDSVETNVQSWLITFDTSTVPPDFRDSETPGNVSLVLSQSTSLVCDVTGSPTPVITWYKDGTPVGEITLNKLNNLHNLYLNCGLVSPPHRLDHKTTSISNENF